MSAPVTDDFEIKPSAHYPAVGNLHLICPYGQGILQNFNPERGMVTIKLSHGGVITIQQWKVRFHRQHQLFAAQMGFQQAPSAMDIYAEQQQQQQNMAEQPHYQPQQLQQGTTTNLDMHMQQQQRCKRRRSESDLESTAANSSGNSDLERDYARRPPGLWQNVRLLLEETHTGAMDTI